MFLWGLFWINVVLIWIAANGTAFLSETGPMWRWPRPAGAPEWETDGNGKTILYATWLATAMDLVLAYYVVLFVWFVVEDWFYACSYDPFGYSPCLIAHWLFDPPIK